MTTITINTLDDIDNAAKRFVEALGARRLVAFYGSMGAGKTTFIKALCTALGVESDVVNSPTFSIVNEYHTADARAIFHFDFYRLNRAEEALDFGLYDYFDSGALCLMEWPENIESLLPDDCVKVHISVDDTNKRTLSIQ